MDTCRRLHIKLRKCHPKVNRASSTLCHVPYNKNIMKALTSYIFFFKEHPKTQGHGYGIMSGKKVRLQRNSTCNLIQILCLKITHS